MKFEKLFKCTSCDKSFTESHSLQIHIKSIEKDFKCGLCCKSYMHLRQIKNHIKKFHEGEYRKPEDDPQIIDLIDEEDIIIVKKEKYYRSKSVHDKLNNETDFEFKKYDNAAARSTHFPNSEKQETKNETSKHAKNLENKDRLKPTSTFFEKERKDHICETCGKEFSRKSVLKSHSVANHELQSCKKSAGHKKFICPTCDLAFTQSQHLKKHVMAIHCVIKYNAGMTKLWKKGKSNKITLLQDKRMKNASENVLKCSACGKTFTNSYFLERHTKSIHRQKLFNKLVQKIEACQYCDWSGANNSQLLLEMHIKNLHEDDNNLNKTFEAEVKARLVEPLDC